MAFDPLAHQEGDTPPTPPAQDVQMFIKNTKTPPDQPGFPSLARRSLALRFLARRRLAKPSK
jgi:hypothetical protein